VDDRLVADKKINLEFLKSIEKQMKELGVITGEDHFVLSCGKHSKWYYNKNLIYPNACFVSDICRLIARRFARSRYVDVVIGPEKGGIILSQWVGYYLSQITGQKIFSLYAEKYGNNFVISRGFDELLAGKKVLVVEDVVSTGDSVRKVVEAVRLCGGYVVGVRAICNRGNVSLKDIACPDSFDSLFEEQFENYEEKDCPLCAEGIPINTKLGHGKKYLERKKLLG
jgi:orotate phosphoribosyltransferase